MATVPTIWVEPGGEGRRRARVDPPDFQMPDGEVVIKPSISGGGHRTARYRTSEQSEHEAARVHVRELVASGRTAMIQPYQASVDVDGELGLVYLAGSFSHAIHKDPMIRPGVGPLDSLIDNQVVHAAAPPTPQQLDLGQQAVRAAEELLGPTTYARVDVVERSDGSPAVLELELLDPVLFFVHHPEGADDFARVISDLVALG